jgi:tRNA-specific 2-thiouridylase
VIQLVGLINKQVNMRVFVGMSGGVDSSVTAYLLQQQGHVVEGVFMKNWEDDDDGQYCSAATDLSDAKSVCNKLGIPLHTVNFSETYWNNVFTQCLEAFRLGVTPNPDVLCNQEIKFDAFLKHCRALGAEKIATGHYAQIQVNDGHHCLYKGLDPNKDQSYFLHRVKAQALSDTLFPLGGLPKDQVRQIAREAGFVTHDKKDSTGICFIGERRFDHFLKEYLPTQSGPMMTPEGDQVGTHDGLMFYTIGQRQGLRIGGIEGGNGHPWYVLGKDREHNHLIVGQGYDHPLLYSSTLTAEQCHWINGPAKIGQRYGAKVRYRQADVPCRVTQIDGNHLTIEFESPVRAVTPGQSVVLYEDECCLGGAIITGKNTDV